MQFHVYQCLVGTISDESRYLLIRAEIAFNNDMTTDVSGQRSIGACYYTCPAPDALFGINAHLTTYGVLVRSSGKAGIDAQRLVTMATLDREAYLPVSLYSNTRQRMGLFLLKCLKDVL